MRVIASLPNPNCAITIFSMNQKFILKFERNNIEQIFKVSEMDVFSLDDVKKMLTDEFINPIIERFETMENDLEKAVNSLY